MIRKGVYRRRIQSRSISGKTKVLLEDDPHCYAVTIEHDGEKVCSISCDSIRTPWSACGRAAGNLPELLGRPLSADMTEVRQGNDLSQQCTHMFDAAAMAIAHAARGVKSREYLVSVDCWSFDGDRKVTLDLDGKRKFDWVINNDVIVSPKEMAGVETRDLMKVPNTPESGVDTREAFFVARRGIYISNNRRAHLDDQRIALDVTPGYGACYVYQPGIAEKATRNYGTTVDFTDDSENGVSFLDIQL